MQMDLWVVAAATSAGYLAKYWKDVLGDKEGSSGFPSRSSFPDNPESSSLSRQNGDKILPSHKSPRVNLSEQYINEAGKGDCLDEMFTETCRSDDPFVVDLGYTNVLDHEKQMDRFEEYKKDYREDVDMPDIPEHQIWEMGDTHNSGSSRKLLRGGRLQCLSLPYVKPRSSLDSCLMAQMHREHDGIEEFLCTPLPSPCTPALRSFLNNERQVMNRASGDFRTDLYKEVHPILDDEVVCVPRLPQIIKTKQNLNKCKTQTERSSNVKKSNRTDTSNGSSSDKVLFCLGISIGVMSNLIANKAEVEKLKDRLKESENLAQDLQEELEMKDSLTVKELVNDDDSQDIHEGSNSHEKMNLFSNQADSGVPIRYNDEESVSSEKIESLSKIEAELEAELERLELSMKGSQGGKSDAFEESDQDVSAELVQGELNADLFGGKSSSEVTPDQGSTPRHVKEGVSPHELSLRLHEVIQSRLQQRIMELEAELIKSQKRIERLESEKNTWRDLSRSESSSNMGSPVAPLKMKPSGDAIGAYNEIHGELNKINGSQNAGSWIHDGNQEDNTRLSSDQGMKKKLIPNQNGGNRTLPNESSRNKDDDRDDDDDDDNDLLLIKHIVEKARQGSPAILKAQKAMLCLNNDN